MQSVTTRLIVQPTPAEERALQEVRRCAVQRRVRLSRHARERLGERQLHLEDVIHALSNARTCVHGDGPRKWELLGPSLDDDELRVIVALEADLIVVTIYGR